MRAGGKKKNKLGNLNRLARCLLWVQNPISQLFGHFKALFRLFKLQKKILFFGPDGLST